jgi:uncharacterized membrane protein YccC
MKTHHILIGYTCFGIGMIAGQGLANGIWWIVVAIIVAIGCIGMSVLINKPPRKKKRLPRRKVR